MKIGIFGDSRIAGVGQLPYGYEGVDRLMRYQSTHTFIKFAEPSTNIAYQTELWNALSAEEQQSFDYLMMEIGHNDADYYVELPVLENKIQTFVNLLYQTKNPSCKIIVNQITPWMGSRPTYIDPQKTAYYNLWVEINAFIAGTKATVLQNIDGCVTEHIALLEDPADPGTLQTIYESGTDRTHPNRLGKDIIADCMLKKIV